MEPKIVISGDVSLKEIYRDKNRIEYFMIIDAHLVKATNPKEFMVPSETQFQVKITKEQYEFLKKTSSDSNTGLRAYGELEISLGSTDRI